MGNWTCQASTRSNGHKQRRFGAIFTLREFWALIIQTGVSAEHIDEGVSLYWDAFGEKLRIPLGPEHKGIAFVRRVFRPDHGISAISDGGQLLGIAGFKTSKGAFVGGDFADLRAIFGLFGASWRAAFLSLLERDTENQRFLMDGIFVAERARGQGVGTALLQAICNEAKRRNYKEVRLDVIDSNPRAKALYERFGFRIVKTDRLGPLKYIFGFSSASTMVFELP